MAKSLPSGASPASSGPGAAIAAAVRRAEETGSRVRRGAARAVAWARGRARPARVVAGLFRRDDDDDDDDTTTATARARREPGIKRVGRARQCLRESRPSRRGGVAQGAGSGAVVVWLARWGSVAERVSALSRLAGADAIAGPPAPALTTTRRPPPLRADKLSRVSRTLQ